jgi:adenylosuccinate lyase
MKRGLPRDEAYRLVQSHALAAKEGGASFRERLLKDNKVAELLGANGVEQIFDIDYHLKHVDAIFRRVFGEEAG